MTTQCSKKNCVYIYKYILHLQMYKYIFILSYYVISYHIVFKPQYIYLGSKTPLYKPTTPVVFFSNCSTQKYFHQAPGAVEDVEPVKLPTIPRNFRHHLGDDKNELVVGGFNPFVLGSKLPIFPYYRGWSSTQ